MDEEPPYILDIRGLGESDAGAPDSQAGGEQVRPWIGINFECCGVYTRIYRNREGSAYVGSCPRCARQVKVKVGAGGTSNRMFRAQ